MRRSVCIVQYDWREGCKVCAKPDEEGSPSSGHPTEACWCRFPKPAAQVLYNTEQYNAGAIHFDFAPSTIPNKHVVRYFSSHAHALRDHHLPRWSEEERTNVSDLVALCWSLPTNRKSHFWYSLHASKLIQTTGGGDLVYVGISADRFP